MRDALVRRERLAEMMREVLSELLLIESKDPRLAGVVVSAVELSGDLKVARAYFSVFGDEERVRQAGDGLEQAKGFLRREAARRMRIHNPPELEFRRDKGFERADRVQRILDEITVHREQTAGESDSGNETASEGDAGREDGDA
ncbi:MAG: 30S ribosome-binding factor RbfA [Thermoanaerobaculales bacterium]